MLAALLIRLDNAYDPHHIRAFLRNAGIDTCAVSRSHNYDGHGFAHILIHKQKDTSFRFNFTQDCEKVKAKTCDLSKKAEALRREKSQKL